ncbi:hypothetical protein K2X05_00555 [bacterium]|nr:hypothetical protein [bacterium]
MKIGVLLFFTTFVFFSQTWACDFNVVKSIVPLEQKTQFSELCLNDYFEKRDLAFQSLSDETMKIVPDAETLVFDDMILFETNKTLPLEENGRLELVEQIFNQYMSNLKAYNGLCELQIYSGEQKLSLNDFLILQRTEGGQPGTRRQLTKDDVASPSWKLLCPNQEGQPYVLKSGKYFFVFVDVYENKTFTSTKSHLAKFMFSFRK